MIKKSTPAALAALIFALLLVAPPAQGAARAPSLDRLEYSHESGDDGRDITLDTTAKRAETIRFKLAYDGDKAHAPGKERRAVTAPGGLHPFAVYGANGGRELYLLIKRALDEVGVANVVVIAENAAGKDKARVPVALAAPACSFSPPLYPFTCIWKL